jgi:hypothetical protein
MRRMRTALDQGLAFERRQHPVHRLLMAAPWAARRSRYPTRQLLGRPARHRASPIPPADRSKPAAAPQPASPAAAVPARVRVTPNLASNYFGGKDWDIPVRPL